MRKAVAIPYVIALVLGIAVIGLIGIWLVITGGKFGGQSKAIECQTEVTQSCLQNTALVTAALPAGCPSTGVILECKVLRGT